MHDHYHYHDHDHDHDHYHYNDHDHHHHNDPAFELVEFDGHRHHRHRIFGVNINHNPGDFIYWDSELELYVPAVEDKCDLMVLYVDRHGTWFEAANVGQFPLKNFTLKGSVYINNLGELTNTETNTKIGFIENGNLYLSIQSTSGGAPYTLPIASSSVLGGVKVGTSLEIDGTGVLDVNNASFIQNQKANAQNANAWIIGSFYAGDVISMQGNASNVFGSYSITEAILSESRLTLDLIELQDKGLNSIFGSYNASITNSIMSSIFGSYSVSLGAPNNTINSERQFVLNSNASSILNANSSIIMNADTCSIGFDSPNIFGSNRLMIVNGQNVNIIAGHDVSVYDSYSINVIPFDQSISNSYAHIMACSSLVVSKLENAIIGAISGNMIKNAHWTSIFSGYGIVATNLESSGLIGVVNSRINADETGTFVSSLLTAAQDMDIESNSYIGWSVVFGQAIRFTDSNWVYSLIGGHHHTLANTLGGSTNNESNIIAGYGHNLEAVNFSLVTGYQNRVRDSQKSIIGSYICDIENSSHNIIVGENSTYRKIRNSVLLGASSTVTHATASFGNLIVGSNLTITESDFITALGSSHTVTNGMNSSVFGYNNQLTNAIQSSIINGTENTIIGNGTDTLEATVVSGLGNSSGYSYQFIMGKYNDNQSDSVLEIGWGTFAVHSNIFRVTNEGVSEQAGLILKHLTNNPTTIADGQMFTKADGLYVKINGALFKVNLTAV